jgi:tetratricopeptide (TPR) repeat protein
MRSQAFVPTIICALLVFGVHPSFPQADEREEIVTLTEQLRKEPNNPALYLRRGDLHRTIQNWDAAHADYDQARTLDAKIEEMDFLKGRVFLEANWPLSAKTSLDRFLAKHSNHLEARIARARGLSKLGHHRAAAQDYTRALELTAQPQPELYIERAQTLAAGGPNYVNEALQGIDDGIKKLGPVVTLQLAALEIEVGQKRYDAALARVEGLIASAQRKETWLARKGEILRDAGRPAEARVAFQAALKAIDTLPPARRNVPATTELEKRIREQSAAIK